jgi:lysophospholipase L1-like esterase
MAVASPAPLTLKQRLFLALGVPAIFIGILELSARILIATGFGASSARSTPMQLEMPTWMLNDTNIATRASKAAPSKDAVDWLSLFVEGQGYRVHLIPNVSREVRNTFSLIPADREKRYRIESNSLGFRSREITETKPPGTFRILVFGDSSSFGWGVNGEDSWSVLLEKELQERYPDKRIEVANFAIPGDSSAYGRLLFDTFAPRFQSDLVILGFGANDAKKVYLSHTDQVTRFKDRKDLLAVSSVLKTSALYRLLDQALDRAGSNTAAPKSKPEALAVSKDDYAQNLHYMGQTAKELGNKNALFLALCTPNDYARIARAEARKSGFFWFNGQSKLVKLLPSIEAGQMYPEYVERMKQSYGSDLEKNRLFYVTSDGCHPNELGHRFVADQLTNLIAHSKIVER